MVTWLLTCLGRKTNNRHGQNRIEGCRGSEERPGRKVGATNLNEDAQDSQALRPLSSLTQAVIGIRIVMYDVELRGEGIESLNVFSLSPPKGFDLSHHHHLQHALNLSHKGWHYPPSMTLPVSRSSFSLAPTMSVTVS